MDLMRLYRGLLASSNRGLERACMSELAYTLEKKLAIPRKQFKLYTTLISGLINIKLADELDVKEVMRQLQMLENEDQSYYINTLKIKPITKVIATDLEEMKACIPEVIEGMQGSFRITLKKRHNQIDSDIIIEAAGSVISNPVDLSNYDWELLIEILGDKMGLCAAPHSMVFSTKKAFEQAEVEDDWFLDDD